jgi:hypothetical protein
MAVRPGHAAEGPQRLPRLEFQLSSFRGYGPGTHIIGLYHAHTLIAELVADRELEQASDRPIVFLCHSLGGIIVKRVSIPAFLILLSYTQRSLTAI